MLTAAIHGFLLALGLILPLGPQNVFIFNQGASQARFARALPAIIAAGLCDTLLILLAVWGVSVIIFDNQEIKIILYLAGICFLMYMGAASWRTRPAVPGTAAGGAMSAKKQMAFAASVSLLNPHALLDTVGVVGTSSLGYAGYEKAAFTIVCAAVSWLWFIGLGVAGKSAVKLDSSGRMRTGINRISALMMWGTAVYLGCVLLAERSGTA
ncbi:LysE/ArgO family amino acid transporter [Paenibacillus humicus]|uniref:LysE/ArgO family amino acid transporter n=1 Tax=Paenibacillus humicus TaxID=412861 RepID=UPI003F167FDB